MGNHEAMMRMALDPATPRWQADRSAGELGAQRRLAHAGGNGA